MYIRHCMSAAFGDNTSAIHSSSSLMIQAMSNVCISAVPMTALPLKLVMRLTLAADTTRGTGPGRRGGEIVCEAAVMCVYTSVHVYACAVSGVQGQST